MVKIYTRTGDGGRTSLFGGGRVPKSHARLEAYGTLDELNAVLGWFRSRSEDDDLDGLVEGIQHDLFDLGAHLATPPRTKAAAVLPVLSEERVADLEAAIDRLDAELEPLQTFVLPGGTETAAILQVARCVCRRAERSVNRARRGQTEILNPTGLAYLNRLSDLLFVMARTANRRAGVAEPLWHAQRPDGAG